MTEKFRHGKNLELQDERVKTLRVKRCQTTILQPEGATSSLRVPLLKNGGTSTGTKIRPTIITTNTCAFDALAQIIFYIYGNQVHLSNEFNNATDEFSKFIQYCFSSRAQEKQVYLKRNALLLNLFPEKIKKVNAYVELDCMCFITEMYDKIANTCEVLKSASIEKECGTCETINDSKSFAEEKFCLQWKSMMLKNIFTR